MDLTNPALCRIIWQLSLLIHSTLESVTTIMTLQNRYLIKTVCALCIPSCSSTVHCVPLELEWAATIVAMKTFLSTWFSTSTTADRRTLLSTAVPMGQALTRGGAAMFTRSTPGCGTLDDPSLAWMAYLCPKLRRSE